MRRLLAITLIVLGTLAVLGSASYLGFARWSTGRSRSFEYTVPASERLGWFDVPTAIPPELTAIPTGESIPPGLGVPARITPSPTPEPMDPSVVGPPSETDPPGVGILYPAQFINPKYWDSPLWAGPDPFGGPGLPDGFERIVSPGQSMSPGTSSAPTRIEIPTIDVDSVVRRLEPMTRGDKVLYEPVDKFVGHIPGTANPGETGTGWYFGHLESPGLGEGNVFHRFPDLPELIAEDPVDVYLHTESAVFAYRVVETAVVRAEDLSLADSRESRIALVASFPPRVYTHRLIVYAELYARRVHSEAEP